MDGIQMKKILIIIALLVATAYPQYATKDTVISEQEKLTDVQRLQLELIQQIGTGLSSRLANIESAISTLSERVNALDDSILVHRILINQILAGGVVTVPSPLPVTDLVATPVSASQANLTWTGAASVYDSIYIYRSQLGITTSLPTELVVLDSGAVSYNNTGLDPTTTYGYSARTVKYVNGLKLFSNYSNSDTATTFDEAPPEPSAGIDYYVSATADGSGDGSVGTPFTLTQALALNVTNKVFSLGVGVYNLSSSINFNKADNTWIGTLHPDDEKLRDADGSRSTVLQVVAGSQATVTMGAANVTLRKMVIEQTESRYLFYVSGADCETDSVAFHYTIETNSSSNHLIQVNGGADNYLMTHCWVYDAPRCAVWVRWSGSTVPDNVIIEYTWFADCDGHNAIQYMPSTETSNVTWQNGTYVPNASAVCKNATVRYCTFENNPYSDLLVFRHCDSVKVYGNLFINSGKINITDQFPTTGYVFDTTSVAWFAYNTTVTNGGYAGAFGNQNGNGVVQKNNIWYNSSNWYSTNLIHRYECGQPSTTGQVRDDLRHQFDYNMYYVAPDPTGATWHSFMGNSTCGYASYDFTQWKALGYDAHSTISTLPSFVNYAGGDYNVTTSNMSGSTTGLPAEITAYTMDGEVRESNSIGMNNKK
jgi:hypothetical protein